MATSTPTTHAFPFSILLLQEWPRHVLPSATAVFFNDNDQQIIQINGIHIGHREDETLLVSPNDYTSDDLLFGNLHHFYTSPPTMIPVAVCHRIRG